ncbi:hypothetical protein BCR33DRAFT_724322 [Rhizoclosmatium globosum]|uniref:SH3 domain-containing protein n=1 Tax=Rhizoclosmatium globosum TaxID=329046 RepID=A0A1Y2B6P5_9FUNG|nr:hypothetical protein BCR33DRAFT_724322 [Rhizoclosmatium globosum]|eukprot:ORY30513.1 hypothetical protein BCR33DRAFT_724322 [Rhizoclosmatium globosum]
MVSASYEYDTPGLGIQRTLLVLLVVMMMLGLDIEAVPVPGFVALPADTLGDSEKASASYFFFTIVGDKDGVACQGFRGRLSLFEGATVTVTWSNAVYQSYVPTRINLFLSTQNASSITNPPHLFDIAKDFPLSSPSSNTFSFLVPTDPVWTNDTYSLQGNFLDSKSGTYIDFPKNTTDVVILAQGMQCDRQMPVQMPINVPLAAGLGGTTAFLLALFTVVTVIRSKKLARLEDKGKFWMDGPRSKHLQKPSLFDRILTRLRPKKKKKPAKKSDNNEEEESDDSSLDEAADESSLDPASPSTTTKNPFISEQEEIEMKQTQQEGYVIPLKDESSDSTSASAKPKAKGPPTTSSASKTVTKKTTTTSFSSFFSKFSNVVQVDGTNPTGLPTDIGNTVRTMADPVTGQLKTYVFLDSRGPPDRNIGGSSKWQPPTAILHQKHRVLTGYTAADHDELSLVRGEHVIVEAVFEDGWCVVYKVEDARVKPEAANKGKNVVKAGGGGLASSLANGLTSGNAGAAASSAVGNATAPVPKIAPPVSQVSWGARVLRNLMKDDGSEELLGDAATGGQRGIVPYNCLFLIQETFVYRQPVPANTK